jgi:hypothetical protein
MSSKAAGALTNSAVKALTKLCNLALPNCTLSICINKKQVESIAAHVSRQLKRFKW